MAIKGNSAQLKYRFLREGVPGGVAGAVYHKIQIVLYCNLAKTFKKNIKVFCSSTLSILHFLRFHAASYIIRVAAIF